MLAKLIFYGGFVAVLIHLQSDCIIGQHCLYYM